jgi:hypothetical protein
MESWALSAGAGDLSRSLWIVAIVVLASCSSHSGRTQHSFQIIEGDGVHRAETSGGPKYTGELFTYEKVMVLDTAQNAEAILYRPTQFMADDDGNMYINDTGIGSILVFDSSGRYTHSIGRQGFGPGEASWWEIQLIRDGIIQAYGIKERRTTRFSIDGALLDVATLSPDIDLLGNTGFIRLPDGRQLILTNDAPTGGRGDKGGNVAEQKRWGAVIFSADWDTIGAAHTPWIRVAKMMDVPKGNAKYAAPMPIAFGPLPTALYHPYHGIVLSPSDRPELQIYDTSGRRTRTIRIDLNSERVTEADRGIARRTLLQDAAQSNEAERTMWESIIEQYAFADEKAFWGMAEIDDEGYFWLDMSLHPEETADENHTFMVLSPEGEYLGMSSRPYGLSTFITRGQMFILEEDLETGEILPTVYRISPAVRGLAYPN